MLSIVKKKVSELTVAERKQFEEIRSKNIIYWYEKGVWSDLFGAFNRLHRISLDMIIYSGIILFVIIIGSEYLDDLGSSISLLDYVVFPLIIFISSNLALFVSIIGMYLFADKIIKIESSEVDLRVTRKDSSLIVVMFIIIFVIIALMWYCDYKHWLGYLSILACFYYVARIMRRSVYKKKSS